MLTQRVVAWFCASLLCLAAASPALAVERAKPKGKDQAIGMVTGPKTGTYIMFGRDIANVAKTEGINITVKESGGSIENIKRITSDENAGLGIVQSDVLGFLKRSKNPRTMSIAENLRLIFTFNKEEVHLLARSEIKNFDDLKGKRVIVGAEGSGSLITAVNLFNMMGVTPAQLLKIDPPEGVVAVLNGEADAMVFVGGKPVRLFKNLEAVKSEKDMDNALLDKIHFLPLDNPKMLEEYSTSTITSDDYSFVKEPVPTIAVQAALVSFNFGDATTSYRKERCKQLAAVGRAIRNNLDYLKANGHPKWKEVDLNQNIGIWKRDECSTQTEEKPAAAAPAQPANSPVRGLEKDLLQVIQTSE